MSGADPEDLLRERLQKSLVKLDRASRGSGAAQRRGRPLESEGAIQAGPARPVPPVAHAAQAPPPPSEPAAAAWPEEVVSDLLERLDRIEERLADLQRPLRPLPASREIFAEWVRLRQWEDMPFGDFLRLRRSGLV